MGGGDLRRGGRAGDADLILVDDGGAADQHDGIGIAAAGIDTVPQDGGGRLGAVRGGGIVGRIFPRGGDLAQNGAGLQVAGGQDDGAAAIIAERFPDKEAARVAGFSKRGHRFILSDGRCGR